MDNRDVPVGSCDHSCVTQWSRVASPTYTRVETDRWDWVDSVTHLVTTVDDKVTDKGVLSSKRGRDRVPVPSLDPFGKRSR